MKKEIIINSTINEVRVAITEDGKLAEFLIDIPEQERFIGNIYLGKVNKIVQGINAAFIDIGLKNDAFLHFSDVDESMENTLYLEEDDEEEEAPKEKKKQQTSGKNNPDATDIALRKAKPSNEDSNGNLATFKTKRSGEVQINLEPKQDVIIQVVREAYGNKGVKVTTKIALPGRYLVLLPFDKIMGVSRKIASYQERRRLRGISRGITNREYGCIIRTAAKGRNEDELKKDWQALLATWKEIEKKVKKVRAPSILYQDMHLASSIVRDLLNSQVERVVIDSKKLHKEITSYLKSVSPNMLSKVEHFQRDEPIFDAFGIEKELELTYKRKVLLSGGGSIVIDQTEAMIVVDVNSGRTTETDQERSAYKTNIEACRAIATQMRLRDIAGIIIVDFIDMQEDNNKRKLFMEMKKEISRDRAKTVVYPLSQLGLMQITRQRINQNIVEKTSEVCPMCDGAGRVTSKVVLLNSIERWLKNFRTDSHEFRLILTVHPHIAAYLTEGKISRLSKLMIKYFVKIKLRQSDLVNIDEFQFYSVRRHKDITREYL